MLTRCSLASTLLLALGMLVALASYAEANDYFVLDDAPPAQAQAYDVTELIDTSEPSPGDLMLFASKHEAVEQRAKSYVFGSYDDLTTTEAPLETEYEMPLRQSAAPEVAAKDEGFSESVDLVKIIPARADRLARRATRVASRGPVYAMQPAAASCDAGNCAGECSSAGDCGNANCDCGPQAQFAMGYDAWGNQMGMNYSGQPVRSMAAGVGGKVAGVFRGVRARRQNRQESRQSGGGGMLMRGSCGNGGCG